MPAADEYLTPSIPTEGVATEVSTAPRIVDPLGSQECPPIPMQEHEAQATGIVSEEDPAGPGSHPSTGPVTQVGFKPNLQKEVGLKFFFVFSNGRRSASLNYLQVNSIVLT